MKKLVFEVRFHPIRKDLRLAPMKVFHTRGLPGESAEKAAERALSKRYRRRDYLIMAAEPVVLTMDAEPIGGLH